MVKIKIVTVAFCLLLLLTVGGRVVLYAAESNTSSEFTITTQSDDPLQILFLVGLHELTRGNYVAAIQVFESLTKQTESPRVKLELARAFFLDRQYEPAKKFFEEVQSDPDLPYVVIENIQFYIDEIDSVLGSMKFSISIVTDSNPRSFTDSREIRIAGEVLTVEPPSDNKKIVGARYTLSAAKALTGNAALRGYFNTSFTDYPNQSFDRCVADAGLLISFKKKRFLRLRFGLEEAFYAGDHLYEFPYVGFMLFPKPLYQFQMNTELKIGKFRVPNASYLDATNLSLTTNLYKELSDTVFSTADIYLENSIADEDAYSYYGGSIGLSLYLPLFSMWELRPYASIGRRLYGGDDPFFGEIRKDTRKSAGVSLDLNNIEFFGFLPRVGVLYEETNSNIDYYSYDKVVFIFQLIEI